MNIRFAGYFLLLFNLLYRCNWHETITLMCRAPPSKSFTFSFSFLTGLTRNAIFEVIELGFLLIFIISHISEFR